MITLTEKDNSGNVIAHIRVIVNPKIKKDNDKALYQYSNEGRLIAKQYLRDDEAYVVEVTTK